MPPAKISTPGPAGSRSGFWLTVSLLLLVMAVVFHRSLAPAQVIAANDAPLGALQAYREVATSFFTGAWHDLNWIGTQEPSALPNLTYGSYLLMGPVVYSKWFVPSTLLFLGLSVWLFFRSLGFGAVTSGLGALAAALNTSPFSYACWGLMTLPLAMGTTFLALAALASAGPRHRWVRLVLAGFAVGIGVMESYDTGALLSLYVAAFGVFATATASKPTVSAFGRALLRVGVVAVCALFIAAQALSTLIETQVKGVAGMAQDRETKLQRWNEATQWSLPKLETLRLVIPGVFGYRLDTPEGGNYWGRVGRDPAWDAYFAEPNPDPAKAPMGYLRHSGSGFYAGVIVVLVGLWAVAQGWRKSGGPFTDTERRWVRFWAAAALVSLLLAFGRHAPFYQLLYALPYSSTIRNPVKFLHPLNLSLIILFGYGLQALWRARVMAAPSRLQSGSDTFRAWWKSGDRGDRRWAMGMIAAWFACLVGWLIYAASKAELARYLQKVGFGSGSLPDLIAAFSIREVGWFVLVLALSVAVVTLILSGALAGTRAKWAGLAVGLVLVPDLVRANAPWLQFYDYREKYATNPLIEFLRQKPHEQRVIGLFLGVNEQARQVQEDLREMYQIEWAQHHFQYYRIQSLDIVQMPRMAEDTKAYKAALMPVPVRMWELTNTRYLLALAAYTDALNQQLDPVRKRFRLHTPFAFSQDRAGGPILAVTNATGPYGLIEFTGALPRAKLYSRWQVNTNDPATLAALADPAFDPAERVLVSNEIPPPSTTATNADAGRVEIEHYEPKVVRLKADTAVASVLLLNDHYHPDWKVYVDGKPAPLLRCNYIMRGVELGPGNHVVEFQFDPPATALYVSLAAVVLGAGLLGFLAVAGRAAPPASPQIEAQSP